MHPQGDFIRNRQSIVTSIEEVKAEWLPSFSHDPLLGECTTELRKAGHLGQRKWLMSWECGDVRRSPHAQPSKLASTLSMQSGMDKIRASLTSINVLPGLASTTSWIVRGLLDLLARCEALHLRRVEALWQLRLSCLLRPMNPYYFLILLARLRIPKSGSKISSSVGRRKPAAMPQSWGFGKRAPTFDERHRIVTANAQQSRQDVHALHAVATNGSRSRKQILVRSRLWCSPVLLARQVRFSLASVSRIRVPRIWLTKICSLKYVPTLQLRTVSPKSVFPIQNRIFQKQALSQSRRSFFFKVIFAAFSAGSHT